MNALAHIEINVSDLEVSREFYKLILKSLGWRYLENSQAGSAGFCAPDNTHLYLIQTDKKYLDYKFHRKHAGLNHVAFRVDSKESVEILSQVLKDNNIEMLYHSIPKDYSLEYGVKEYFAVFFEDPDNIKIEIVYIR